MTRTERVPAVPLGRPVRVLQSMNRLLVRVGLIPRAEHVGSIPIGRRLAMKPPGWAVPKPTGAVQVEDRTAPGRHGDIPLRIYRPVSGRSAPTAVLYLHGGGFTIGGLDSLDWFCRELAGQGGHVVVSVQYRLAPDHPYPGPLDDVQDALDWLQAHHRSFGANDIAVAGDSAGGNLAAAVCGRARDQARPAEESLAIRRQILIYPALDATHSSPSTAERGSGLSRDDIVHSFRYYRGDRPPNDPEISPLLATDHAGLPETLVLTADHDILRDEGRRYAEALEAAGVSARTIEYPGTDHGFLSLPVLFKQASRDAIADVLAALRTDPPTDHAAD